MKRLRQLRNSSPNPAPQARSIKAREPIRYCLTYREGAFTCTRYTTAKDRINMWCHELPGPVRLSYHYL